MSDCLIKVIKAGAVTLIASKALRCFGKKDYADIIKFSGICVMAVPIIKLVTDFIQDPPWIFKMIGKLF